MGTGVRIRNATGTMLAGTVQKAYDFLELDNNELEINMYGEVVESVPVDWWTRKPTEGLYICEKDFLNDLEQYKEKSKITVRINSVGGDLYAGLAIANRMKDLDAEVITIADALCASAAVAIFEVGNTRKVYSGSQIMIHEPSCYIYGRYDVQGIKKVAKQLEAGKKSLVKTYQERTGRSSDDLEKMIAEDSWMTGQEAIDEGFADELMEGTVDAGITEDKKAVISNGVRFPAEAFFSMPKNLRVIKADPGMRPDAIQNKGGNEKVNKEELKKSDPELYNSILADGKTGQDDAVKAAVDAERKRIQEIDEIAASIGDKKLIEEAKFGETQMDAKTLAFEALKKQKTLGNQFLRDQAEDTQNSGVNNVTPEPNAGTKTKEEQKAQDIRDGAAMIAGIQKGDKA
ncbi:MAG: head maturation protease, ClpP-related [Gallintestinimicrobium sp.]|uniref:head maturation protease, ClpP-related n=1 Tax=Gallintestinimicrobium sp. TaxID=2981655 RepID=UPI0039954AF1